MKREKVIACCIEKLSKEIFDQADCLKNDVVSSSDIKGVTGEIKTRISQIEGYLEEIESLGIKDFALEDD